MTTTTDLSAHLRFLTQSGRLNDDWQRPLSEAFAAHGLPTNLAAEDWATIAWYGPLDLWLHQQPQRVTDIQINGPAHEVIITEGGRDIPSGIRLHPSWIDFIQQQLLARSGRHSAADAAAGRWCEELPIGVADGRIRYALTRAPATRQGATLSLRILPEQWRSLSDLVADSVLSAQAAELLIAALRQEVTILVSGDTGSGKTTLTAALLLEIGQERRAVIIEQASELPLLPNSVNIDAPASGASFSACVAFALRQKPNLIVVGEVRGGEAFAMLKAAASGHPGIGTIHAPHSQAALHNLERMAIEGLGAESSGVGAASLVRGMIASEAIPLLVVHVSRVGGTRRVRSIDEVLPQGGGKSGDKYPTNPIYAYDSASDQLLRQMVSIHGAWARGTLL